MANAYEEARVKSRAEQKRVTSPLIRSIRETISDFINRVLASLRGTRTAFSVESATFSSTELMAEQLENSIGEARDDLTASVAGFWEQAGESYALVLGALVAAAITALRKRKPPIPLVAVWNDLSTENWRSLLRQYSGSASREVAHIIRAALQEGMSADELSIRLRRYVIGSEPFQSVFGDSRIDLRRVPKDLRGAAQQMVFNSQRIAFTELQNARAEAEIRSFWQDPLVLAVQWELSPNRGRSWTPPDECDLLAVTDFYGLGKGVYPIRKCPPPPHPFDLCERMPIIRSAEQIEEPKPNPEIVLDPFEVEFPGSSKLSSGAIRLARQSAWEALKIGMSVS